MKKLLAIIVLGLLTSCASGVPYKTSGGSNTKDVGLSYWLGGPEESIVRNSANEHCKRISSNLNVVNLRQTHKTKGISDWTSEHDLWKFDCEEKSKVVQINKQKKAMSSTNKIAEAKKVCKELGFKPKSEKFSDCALKMVMLDFERKPASSESKSPQVVIHKNQSNTNVFDELDTLFRRQGIIQDTSRPSSSRNSFNCTSSRTVFGQVVTNCR